MGEMFNFRHQFLPQVSLRAGVQTSSRRNEQSLYSYALLYIASFAKRSSSKHSIANKINDLQKFLDYFYSQHSDGSILRWDKAITNAFCEALRCNYSIFYVARIMSQLREFHRYSIDVAPMKVRKGLLKKASGVKDQITSLLNLRQASDDRSRQIYGRVSDYIRGIERLLDDKKQQKLRFCDVAIIKILDSTALRSKEICCVDLEQLTIDVSSGSGVLKNIRRGKYRLCDVHLTADVVESLLNYFEKERGYSDGPLFMTVRSIRYSSTEISLRIKKIMNIIQEDTGTQRQYIYPNARMIRNGSLYRTAGDDSLDINNVSDRFGYSINGYDASNIYRRLLFGGSKSKGISH